ncbi:hypothetical protein [Curtobacterium sp. VKM Ac-2887]|uniref:hypothetical protein n=1 Tax=Curtobacterium sp. VKM Ac-2887 TaxID=2783819 RepID=UPI001889CECF|nr:hypothetical protein [Curtobacterium sp. VKM Ac-2887]MBF4587991.1 hypothetical protein [Curtobacterium sp. VKM Ac-2887]
MVTSDDVEWLRSPPVSRELQRASARARPPHIRVHDAEQFRREVLQHIDVLARLDVTAAERAETAAWRHRIEAAPSHRVWVEYQHPSSNDQGAPG